MNNLSHILEIYILSEKPKSIEWQASQEECKALADRLKILEVKSFSAKIIATRKDLIELTGKIEAEVVQACVVTGEPVIEKISDSFEEFFCEKSKHSSKIDIDMDSPDVTPLEGEKIDVGELATQYLILALNPYPRKEGAVMKEKIEKEDYPNPFAVLEKLKH